MTHHRWGIRHGWGMTRRRWVTNPRWCAAIQKALGRHSWLRLLSSLSRAHLRRRTHRRQVAGRRVRRHRGIRGRVSCWTRSAVARCGWRRRPGRGFACRLPVMGRLTLWSAVSLRWWRCRNWWSGLRPVTLSIRWCVVRRSRPVTLSVAIVPVRSRRGCGRCIGGRSSWSLVAVLPRGCCRRCPTRSRSSGGCVGRDHRSVMTVSRRSSSSVTTCLVCGRHTLAWGRSCRCGARSVGTGG